MLLSLAEVGHLDVGLGLLELVEELEQGKFAASRQGYEVQGTLVENGMAEVPSGSEYLVLLNIDQ